MDKQANFSNTGAGEMEFDLFDGGKDGEHGSDSFVEIPSIFPMQDNFFHWFIPFDKVCEIFRDVISC